MVLNSVIMQALKYTSVAAISARVLQAANNALDDRQEVPISSLEDIISAIDFVLSDQASKIGSSSSVSRGPADGVASAAGALRADLLVVRKRLGERLALPAPRAAHDAADEPVDLCAYLQAPTRKVSRAQSGSRTPLALHPSAGATAGATAGAAAASAGARTVIHHSATDSIDSIASVDGSGTAGEGAAVYRADATARVAALQRALLLAHESAGGSKRGAKGSTARGGAGAGADSHSLTAAERAVADQESEQSVLADDMSQLLQALKSGGQQLHDYIAQDNAVLDSTQTLVEDNLTRIADAREKLAAQNAASMSSMWYACRTLFLVAIMFVVAYMVIKVFPKPPPLVHPS